MGSIEQSPVAAPSRAPAVAAARGGGGLMGATRTRPGVWARFRRHRLALVGLALLLALTLVAVLAPELAGLDPYKADLRAYRKPPSEAHWLGTDAAGRDVLARLVYGARVSLSVGLVAVGIYVALGIVIGAIAGFYGRWADGWLMRLADVVMAFPRLVIIITIAALLGPSIYNVMLIIGLLGWPPIARIVRGMFLSLRERDFVMAARVVGASNGRIIFRHLAPNVMAPVIVAATFGMAGAILLEAGLSFLGLGVQPPMASWGNMLNAAQSLSILEGMPWLWLPPGLMIALTVLSLNFVGDGLRDALDPHYVVRSGQGD
jgi:peptide/nickel transport system permease protein